MNYPIQSLVILGPILFLVLMIGFPIIGLFAGWKRAAYWGGGNFLFYIIGLIVFATAGPAIANALSPLIASLIGQQSITAADLAKITQSLTGPILFILIFAIGELILLINYYTWFKRVSGIKKEVAIKKALKLAKKQNREATVQDIKLKPKLAQKYNIQEKDFSYIKSNKYKAINMSCGAVGLLALTVPSTIAFTQATMYLTTSSATRAKNSFASGLYQGLNNLNQNVSWFSFYQGKNVGEDFDALFSALALSNKKIVVIDPTTGKEVEKPVIDVVEETISDGLEDISKAIEKMDPKDETSVQAAVNEMNNFTDQWNNIVSQAGTELGGMLNSSNLLAVAAKALKPATQEEITDQKVEELTKDGNLEKIIAGTTSGQIEIEGKTYSIHKIEKIDISPTSKQQFVQMLVDNYDTSKLSEDSKTKFTDAVAKLSGLLFE